MVEIDQEWQGTTASVLVQMVDDRLGAEWVHYYDGPGMWRWQLDREGESSLVVAINAREDRVLVPAHGWPAKVGPTVLAGKANDTFASVTLPNISDYSDARGALWVLSRVIPALWGTEGE
jgi:hypothetical protein